MKTNILLICGSFNSANFYVMLSVIRSMGDVHIHAISANNEDIANLPQYADVTYYPVYNWRVSFMKRVRRMKAGLLSKGIEYLFCHLTGHLDHYVTSIYERNIHRKCKDIIETNHIDAIFTVCLRFYTHRIGMKLHADTKIKWFQFWVDPYSNTIENVSTWWRKEAEKIEKNYFEAADKIFALPEVFVGNRVIETYRNKLVLFEIPYLENKESETKTKNVIFAGSLIEGVREPGPVVDLLHGIMDYIDSEICFHFYVPDKTKYAQFENNTNNRIVFHNYVNHETLNKLLGEALMLLNIGNAGSIQMPSKTVEYVSYRKPLLFFYKDRNDASLRYLRDYPDICRICVDDDTQENREKLIKFFNTSHDPISFESLIKIKEFKESTPEYIRSLIEAS